MRLQEDEQEILEAVLNLAQITADSQLDDDAKEDAQTVIEALADLFEIPRTRVTVDEQENSDGTITLTITQSTDDVQKKPHLTVISNDQPHANNNDEPGDDDTRH